MFVRWWRSCLMFTIKTQRKTWYELQDQTLTYHSTMMRCKLFSLYLNFFFHEWFNVFTLFASRSMFVHKEEMVKWIWANRRRLTQLIALPIVRHGLTTKFDNWIILKKKEFNHYIQNFATSTEIHWPRSRVER